MVETKAGPQPSKLHYHEEVRRDHMHYKTRKGRMPHEGSGIINLQKSANRVSKSFKIENLSNLKGAIHHKLHPHRPYIKWFKNYIEKTSPWLDRYKILSKDHNFPKLKSFFSEEEKSTIKNLLSQKFNLTNPKRRSRIHNPIVKIQKTRPKTNNLQTKVIRGHT